MKNFKEKGITLIALVITIIVLLILAGVTLNLVAGGDGILDRATTAVKRTNKEKIAEEVELAMAELKTEYYEGRYVTKTIESTKEFNEYAKEKLEKEENNEIVGIKTASGRVYLKETKIIYENEEGVAEADGTFNANNGSVTINGTTTSGITPNQTKIPEGLEIGSTISYAPTGNYQWNAAYCSSDLSTTNDGKYTEYNSDGYGLLDSSTESFKITTWKVLETNSKTGEITMVPVAPTTGEVYLGQAQGYNNGVKLLNDACSALYGTTDVTARSINIGDIEKYLDYDKTEYVSAGSINGGSQPQTPLTVAKNYPVIYAQEELSEITPAGATEAIIIEKGEGLGASDQTRLIERTEGTSATENIGKITTATSIRPYQLFYYMNYDTIKTKMEQKYVDLLIPQGKTNSCWIASRAIDIHNNSYHDYVAFGMYRLGTGNVSADAMMDSAAYISSEKRGLFPVVTLNASKLSGDATAGWSVK